MIQLVINTNMLRELDERRLINTYARLVYNGEEDTSNENKIKENLLQLLDWDINGDRGLGIFCSKFENIKRKDWNILINFIKDNHHEIRELSYGHAKKRRLESIKVVNSVLENKKERIKTRFKDSNYKVSGRGKKAKPCIFEGRSYKSRQECMYKENITQHQLYNYLKETNQL